MHSVKLRRLAIGLGTIPDDALMFACTRLCYRLSQQQQQPTWLHAWICCTACLVQAGGHVVSCSQTVYQDVECFGLCWCLDASTLNVVWWQTRGSLYLHSFLLVYGYGFNRCSTLGCEIQDLVSSVGL